MKVDQSSTELINENAQMAESVDALVSNTSAFTGMPVRLRLWVLKQKPRKRLLLFLSMASVYILHSKSAGEFYTGSSKDAEQRYEYHINKEFPASYREV